MLPPFHKMELKTHHRKGFFLHNTIKKSRHLRNRLPVMRKLFVYTSSEEVSPKATEEGFKNLFAFFDGGSTPRALLRYAQGAAAALQ